MLPVFTFHETPHVRRGHMWDIFRQKVIGWQELAYTYTWRFNLLGFSPLWFEPRSGHMWESQVLLTDGQVFFLRALRFSPTFDDRSARYKGNILERAVKPKSKKKKKKKNAVFFVLFSYRNRNIIRFWFLIFNIIITEIYNTFCRSRIFLIEFYHYNNGHY